MLVWERCSLRRLHPNVAYSFLLWMMNAHHHSRSQGRYADLKVCNMGQSRLGLIQRGRWIEGIVGGTVVDCRWAWTHDEVVCLLKPPNVVLHVVREGDGSWLGQTTVDVQVRVSVGEPMKDQNVRGRVP
jgi:hypothetical protein